MPILKKISSLTAALVLLQRGDLLGVEPASIAPAGSLIFSLGKMLLALGVMLAALLLISYLAKRFRLPGIGPMVSEAPVKVLATKYLGGKKSIWVVEIEGERLVLGVGSEGISFLTKLRGSEGGI